MFTKVSICFVLWYAVAQAAMAFISSSDNLTASWLAVALAYVLTPLLCGAYLIHSLNKAA
jgi:hypothetical protein